MTLITTPYKLFLIRSWCQLIFTCKDLFLKHEAIAYAMFRTHCKFRTTSAHSISFGGVLDYNTETIHHGCLEVDLSWYSINELSYILLISNLRWQLGCLNQFPVKRQVKDPLVRPYWST